MGTVLIEHNMPARMRDGVKLYADIYCPADAGQYPVLLTRMPYGKEALRPMLSQFVDPIRAAQAGYVVIMQDCRGFFASEGEDQGIAQEGPDGYDSVEWAAALPCSNGAVGMWGGSYLGLDQWIAAEHHPPHLRALVPFSAPTTSADGIFFRGGVLEFPDALLMELRFGLEKKARGMKKTGAQPLEIMRATRAIAEAIEGLRQRDLDELPLNHLASLEPLGLAECLTPWFVRGASQPEYAVDFSQVEVPALIICGWYDGALPQSLYSFSAVKERGHGTVPKPHLMIGPWSHGHFGLGRSTMIGEMEFGMAASAGAIDLTAIHLRWFDHWLKGAENGVEAEPPVLVFFMGEKRWRTLPDWPPPGMKLTPWFLQPRAGLAPATPGTATPTRYIYDPANPAPTLGGGGSPIGWHGLGVRDQRPLSSRSDVLTFAGPRLDHPYTVAGQVSATLWASSSAPDTDFVVRLIDIHPNGYMHNLCDGVVRARYRNSLAEPAWLTPRVVYEFHVELWPTAHTFQPGHQVAMQVTSSNFPRWDRNLNTMDAPGSGNVGQVAQQSIWHGGEYASCIWLPELPEGN